MSRQLLCLLLLILTACRFPGSHDTARTAYDFGPPPAHGSQPTPVRVPAGLVVTDFAAPRWMDNAAMYYRLAYRDETNPLAYTHSQWVMPPAALLTQRFRWLLEEGREGAGVISGPAGDAGQLSVEVEAFQQIFDRPDQSRGVLRVRATLRLPARNTTIQRTFDIEKPAPTADAAGGVKALILCATELSDGMADWITDQMRRSTSGQP
jgi:cholesterol transport system auxiliary component